MDVARVFMSGGSQAVRLPKSCRFSEEEVFVNRIGSALILTPKAEPWKSLLESLPLFSEDFLAEGIESLPLQERKLL